MNVKQGIFRQYDVRGIVGEDLTPGLARALGRAYAAELGARGMNGAIVVGRDNRPSGTALRDALVDGLVGSGREVVDIGVVPTPLVYWSLHHLPVDGGIQITGSHNPAEYNGFKMCLGTRSLYGEAIQSLYHRIVGDRFVDGRGTLREERVVDRYIEDIAMRAGAPQRPIRVVVDCGNGTAALVAPALFDRLGIDWKGLYCESDGSFPNHHPDPTVPENLEDLIDAVRSYRAELGIAFDGDADRIGVVDSDGTIIWGDHLLILYARDVLERTGRGKSIIFDVKCSQALPHEIEAAGGHAIMWRTGHSLIKEKMKEEGAPLAGEMSGHMFFSEGFYGHDDALYAAARLLRILGAGRATLAAHLDGVPEFVSTPELRVDCADERKFAIVEAAVAHFRAHREVIDVDGARVLFGDGWGLIRASNTQPILVTRFEAGSEARLREIREEMESWLRSQGVQP